MHGGGYILNTDEKQYNFFKQAIEELGYGLIVPDYPLCAAYVYTDAYDMLHDVYLDWVARAGADNIIFFGDSAGGALVIGMAQYLRDKSEPLPRAVIGFSPWLDATLTNEDIHLVDDVIMPLAQLQNCGLLWAGDDNPRTYRVSPIYGDFQGLPPLHIFIGGRDMFYADVAKLRERMKKEKLPLTVYEYPHMFHVWADLLPQMPESKDAIKHIVKILKEN